MYYFMHLKLVVTKPDNYNFDMQAMISVSYSFSCIWTEKKSFNQNMFLKKTIICLKNTKDAQILNCNRTSKYLGKDMQVKLLVASMDSGHNHKSPNLEGYFTTLAFGVHC